MQFLQSRDWQISMFQFVRSGVNIGLSVGRGSQCQVVEQESFNGNRHMPEFYFFRAMRSQRNGTMGHSDSPLILDL
jgi:hypothetical protein